MSKPRCGVKDKVGSSDTARRKRYALQGERLIRKTILRPRLRWKKKTSETSETSRGAFDWRRPADVAVHRRRFCFHLFIRFHFRLACTFHPKKCKNSLKKKIDGNGCWHWTFPRRKCSVVGPFSWNGILLFRFSLETNPFFTECVLSIWNGGIQEAVGASKSWPIPSPSTRPVYANRTSTAKWREPSR